MNAGTLPRALSACADSASAARVPRLALSQEEAAAALGVSADFFAEWIRHELRVVRRGRRRLYPVTELQRWLEEGASRPLEADR
jgi:excisionase family DNA binding protein